MFPATTSATFFAIANTPTTQKSRQFIDSRGFKTRRRPVCQKSSNVTTGSPVFNEYKKYNNVITITAYRVSFVRFAKLRNSFLACLRSGQTPNSDSTKKKRWKYERQSVFNLLFNQLWKWQFRFACSTQCFKFKKNQLLFLRFEHFGISWNFIVFLYLALSRIKPAILQRRNAVQCFAFPRFFRGISRLTHRTRATRGRNADG